MKREKNERAREKHSRRSRDRKKKNPSVRESVMVTLATASATSLFGVTLPSPNFGKKGTKIGNGPTSLGGLQVKHAASGGLQVKANAQTSAKINCSAVATSVDDSLMFRQEFSIKSYEVDANRKASIETLLNFFQETAINHFKRAGLQRDGFGSTQEMCKKNLVWVFTKMQFVAYRYPTWGDDVEVQAWMSALGKNAVRRNWILRDLKTNEVLTRASSVCVMMNKLTRRLSKIPEEARREFESYFVNSALIMEDDNRKLPKLDDKTADYICTCLHPRWSDLDVNFHVNNAKYIGWIVESVPPSILLNHELSAMTVKYRRECGRDSKLQSLTSVCEGDGSNLGQNEHVECNHLLRLEEGAEIVRGRTEWRPKPAIDFGIANHHAP